MEDPLKDVIYSIEDHVNASVGEFTSADPSKSLYLAIDKRLGKSVIDMDQALSILADLEMKHRRDMDVKQHLAAMSFFLGKMREESKGRISQAIRLENPVLVLASLQILKRNWSEVKDAYGKWIEVTSSPKVSQDLE